MTGSVAFAHVENREAAGVDPSAYVTTKYQRSRNYPYPHGMAGPGIVDCGVC